MAGSGGFGLELDVHLPRLAKRLDLAAGRELALDLAVRELEVAHLEGADGTEAALLEVGVSDLAADDLTVFVDGDNEGAAVLSEPGADPRLLVLGVILLGKDDDDGGLVRQRFPF